MKKRMSFNGSPNIGVFVANTEELAVVPPELSQRDIEIIKQELKVEIIRTTIDESSVVGSLIAGNSHGLIVSKYALDSEILKLRKFTKVAKLPDKMTAVGNLILANDYAAIVHPQLSKKAIEVINRTLRVKAVKGTIAGLKTVGTAGVATNRGLLVHPNLTEEELKLLEKVFELPVDIGTVNLGSPLIGTALIANSKGYLAGSMTTGFELGRIEEALGFI
ncbi:MAG: translation initiation factor IF-6 [Methanocellales archaeon]